MACLVLLDFSKAFNTLDPTVLCQKLFQSGFDNISIKLMRCYLKGRRQFVKYNGRCSIQLPVNLEVPQGSVLGPMLFSIYIADFNKFPKNCKIHVYADVTQIYMSFCSERILESCRSINNDLSNLVYNVASARNLNLDADKSKVILFGPKKKREQVTSDCKI
nr:unnamed protein product [Callosobruchus chinensis]